MSPRKFALLIAASFIVLLVSACAGVSGPPVFLDTDIPKTQLPFLNDPDEFQFVVIGDRTGGHRPGVFRRAISQINLLRPEFVLCVGDLIEGYSEDLDEINRQWQDVENTISLLEMPFFYTAGNHDISNALMLEVWQQRLGRDYYAFLYRDVLFLSLSTEDPAVEMADELIASQIRLEKLMATAPQETQKRLLQMARQRPPVSLPGSAAISQNQLDFIRVTLKQHKSVRWTILLMHKPAWQYSSVEFAEIETMLQDRNYSVIAGHEHYYSYTERYGRDYIDMGTTGGVWLKDGAGRGDHITWVTMTNEGPIFANIKLDGVFDKHAIGQSE
ncbi:metallophosphoesterase [Zhongshania sp.]|uniref:metallophosphoesterase family protein n=1 Tax=Zhongshania sp. TaxID=1971902 RepID=UPI00356700AF